MRQVSGVIMCAFQYADVFTRDRISAFALLKADEAQLQHYGVSSKIHRMRLIQAIANGELKNRIDGNVPAPDAAAPPPRPASSTPKPASAAPSPAPAANPAAAAKPVSKVPSMAAVPEALESATRPTAKKPSVSSAGSDPAPPARPPSTPSESAPPRKGSALAPVAEAAAPAVARTPVADGTKTAPRKGSVSEGEAPARPPSQAPAASAAAPPVKSKTPAPATPSPVPSNPFVEEEEAPPSLKNKPKPGASKLAAAVTASAKARALLGASLRVDGWQVEVPVVAPLKLTGDPEMDEILKKKHKQAVLDAERKARAAKAWRLLACMACTSPCTAGGV